MNSEKAIGRQIKQKTSESKSLSPIKRQKTDLRSQTSSVPKKQVHRPRGTGDIVCPKCYNRYREFNNMIRHMKKSHGSKAALSHRKKFNKEKQLINGTNNSIKSQLKPKTISCDNNISPKTSIKSLKSGNKSKILSQSVKSIDLSANQTVSEDLSEWKCDFNCCQRSYSSKSNLKRHQWEIHKKLSKALFYQKNRSENYMNVKYFIPKAAKSTVNFKSFDEIPKAVTLSDNNNQIDESQTQPITKQIQSTADKKFVCNHRNCLKSFYSYSGLYRHRKNVHKSNKALTKIAVTKGGKTFNKTNFESTGTTNQINSEFADNSKSTTHSIDSNFDFIDFEFRYHSRIYPNLLN